MGWHRDVEEQPGSEQSMEYTVKFRRPDGTLDQMVVKAASRSELFSELKRRGVSAVNVSEGGGAAMPIKRSGGSPVMGVAAGALVVLLVGAVACLLLPVRSRPSERKPSPGPRLIAEVKPSLPTQTVARAETRALAKPPTAPTPTGETAAVSAPEAERKGLHPEIPLAHPRKKRVFKSASDQILAMVAQIAEGKSVPPMPIDKNFEREFFESLKQPIVIDDDDSERVKALKELVRTLRKELLARAENGESVHAVLKDYERRMAEDYKTRRELQQEARQILESGDREGAKNFVTKMNSALQQMGIKEIEMPMTAEERRAWAEEYLRQRDAEREQSNKEKR